MAAGCISTTDSTWKPPRRTTRSPAPPVNALPENRRIAERLGEAARLLAAQDASAYRVAAYRAAAESVATHPLDVRAIFEGEGVKGLDAIPRVGLGIAAAIAEMLVTGRWAQLERLRGTTDPATLFQSVPGIGPALAQRIRDTLHVETLEDLEAAANDGRLDHLRGVGPRRAAACRASLEDVLGRLRAPRVIEPRFEPPVEAILDVDREYRARAAAGGLRTIAPRRFNPAHERWLPILHAQRGPWHFTALYSNTALAHRLGRLRDWVVVYFYDGDHVERQRTVVTEPRGPLAGLRVVRGREDECHRFHQPGGENHASHASHAA
jgi:DNA polymerase (family 10)